VPRTLRLQVLDDGRLTDSSGNVVNFKNCIIVFTSNIGSDRILEVAGDPSRRKEMRHEVMRAMKDSFRPEFINRVDEFVIFDSLGTSQLREIVRLELNKLQGRLVDRRITLNLSDAAFDYVADTGYDAVYGARPLKRALQRAVETPLAKMLLSQEARDGDTVLADVANGHLQLTLSSKDNQLSPSPT